MWTFWTFALEFGLVNSKIHLQWSYFKMSCNLFPCSVVCVAVVWGPSNDISLSVKRCLLLNVGRGSVGVVSDLRGFDVLPRRGLCQALLNEMLCAAVIECRTLARSFWNPTLALSVTYPMALGKSLNFSVSVLVGVKGMILIQDRFSEPCSAGAKLCDSTAFWQVYRIPLECVLGFPHMFWYTLEICSSFDNLTVGGDRKDVL